MSWLLDAQFSPLQLGLFLAGWHTVEWLRARQRRRQLEHHTDLSDGAATV